MTKERIYFAHCKNDYHTEQEAEVIKRLEDMGWQVVNPSSEQYQNTCVHNSMSYWFGIVRSCDAVAFTKYKGVITAGVGQEVNTAIEEKKPAYLIFEFGFQRIYRPVIYLDVEATRRLMYPERYAK